MTRNHEILTAVGTLACAVGIGFFMQSGQDAQQRYGKPVVVPKTQGMVTTPAQQEILGAIQDDAVLSVEDMVLTSVDVSNLPVIPASDSPIKTSDAPQSNLETPDTTLTALGCHLNFSASVSAAALVDLALDAPCLPNERLSIHHNGMVVTYVTSETGQLNVTFPALSEDATFEAAFAGGATLTAQISVNSLALYDRAVVQWTGQDAVQLHALEFGADYGDKGHVWSGAPRDISAISSGLGGFITHLGHARLTAARQADVYTFPKATATGSGIVDLTVEAEVTPSTCGKTLNAKTLQLDDQGNVNIRDVSLDVPGCEAEGDFLVLNNLLLDLKVAQK